jgi:hypothetical protein
MSFKYLNNNKWKDVTRDERLFCSYLYHYVKNDTLSFINLINSKNSQKIDINIYWEIGFEVNIYRDLFGIKTKRTFDLCLFSEEMIIIIEAKAHQGFQSAQSKEFIHDKQFLKSLLIKYRDSNVDVKVCALASSKYFKNIIEKYKILKLPFESDYILSWEDCEIFDKEIFRQADETYKKIALSKIDDKYLDNELN